MQLVAIPTLQWYMGKVRAVSCNPHTAVVRFSLVTGAERLQLHMRTMQILCTEPLMYNIVEYVYLEGRVNDL